MVHMAFRARFTQLVNKQTGNRELFISLHEAMFICVMNYVACKQLDTARKCLSKFSEIGQASLDG